jgi:hypothetical protein
MKTHSKKFQQGNGLVVTVSVVMTVLTILGAAISYTTHLSRISARSRRTALAMEIADGHLEYLFTNWRNIYRKTWTTYNASSGGTDYSTVGTNYFYTASYTPSNGCSGCATPSPVPNMTPAATPPQISLPATTNFPTEANYVVKQYRIQAVDPMVDLCGDNAVQEVSKGNNTSKDTCDTSAYVPIPPGSVPPGAYGPNCLQNSTICFPYSFFYLASVDIEVPAIGIGNTVAGVDTGYVMAKVRRVFEKKFDLPWTYAVLFMDDLEFQPSSALTITGPIQTNGSLYIGTSNFTTTDRVGYGGDYVNGFSPNDTTHNGSATAPNFPANEPPSQSSPLLPFGWNLANGESYHQLIERPPAGGDPSSDPMSNIRYYNQADYRVLIDASNNITITDYNNNAISGNEYKQIHDNMTTNQVIWDNRENAYVRITSVNVGAVTSALNKLPAWNHTGTGGIIYFSDTSAGTSVSVTLNGTTSSTTERGIRLTNGGTLPSSGMTVVAENPVYIQGDYNTGGPPPSDSGTFTDPDKLGYTRVAAAVIGDAIDILSGAWVDTNSDKSISSRIATSTTVNAALVGGEVPSGGGKYSGGGEGFVRFLEDWQKNSNTFTYYGSMVELFNSLQATGAWSSSASIFKQPGLHWYYDTNFGTTGPPGRLQIAAYLQQQRWYQVY